MEYFCVVVEEGSLSAAARTMYISQPALTVAMRNLERGLATTLLTRTAQGVRPTKAGRYFYEEARRVLQDVAAATTHLRDLALGLAGHVTISAGSTYSWAYLAAVLDALAAAAPAIQVRLFDPPPLDILRRVSAGEDDLGIVTTSDPARLLELYGDSLQFKLLCEFPIIAALPPSFSRAPEPIDLNELRDPPWVVPNTPPTFPGMAALMAGMWRRQGWRPRAILNVSASETSLPMIAGGLGVALMPSMTASLAGGTIVTRQVEQEVPPLVAAAVWRADRHMTPATATVLRVLADVHQVDPDPRIDESVRMPKLSS